MTPGQAANEATLHQEIRATEAAVRERIRVAVNDALERAAARFEGEAITNREANAIEFHGPSEVAKMIRALKEPTP